MKKSLDVKKVESLSVPGLGVVKPGLQVIHPHFGVGTVVALFEFPPISATRYSIGIEFGSVGYKALVPKYAKLKLNDA